jgi:hypothetical protein
MVERQPVQQRQNSETRMAVGIATNNLVVAKENNGDADLAMRQLLETLTQPGAIDLLLTKSEQKEPEVTLQPGIEATIGKK